MKVYASVGDSVMVISQRDSDRPHVCVARVHRATPLLLQIARIGGSGSPSYVPGSSLTLLADHDGATYRADATVVESLAETRGVFVEVEPVSWDRVEHRRSRRCETRLPAQLHAPEPEDGAPTFSSITATLIDVSLNGALVECAARLDTGWLVHFRTDLPDFGSFGAVAQVVRRELSDNGLMLVALDFVDFITNALTTLRSFLQAAGCEEAA